jgi:CRISPR-associated protein Cmr4
MKKEKNMFKKAQPFFIKVITPLHAGSGDDLGIVDLPIQRERHTSFPKIEGSSLKGAIRESFEDRITEAKDIGKLSDPEISDDDAKRIYTLINDQIVGFEDINKPWIYTKKENNEEKFYYKKDQKGIVLTKYHECISLAFGPETGDAHAGALGFTDARILLFPVKSVKGVFAYITCPTVLKRFQEDLKLCKDIEIELNDNALNVGDGSCLVIGNKLVVGKDKNKKVLLEEYCFKVSDPSPANIADKLEKCLVVEDGSIKDRLVILSDDDFKDFVNLSTEVITRTKISAETGTISPGALWTEEYLPSETVLYSLAMTTKIFQPEDKKGMFSKKNFNDGVLKDKSEAKRVMNFFTNGTPDMLQIGGNATIGKGICKIIREENNEQ